MSKKVEIVAVLGSVTPPGRLQGAVEDMLDRARSRDALNTTFLNLAELEVALADGRPADQLSDDTMRVIEQISAADAAIFATPVYRGSLTGVLKNLLDQLPVFALSRKPVAIISMGAAPQHYLGAERHLRDVLAFFGAVLAPVACYLQSADFEDGVLRAGAADQLDELIDGLVMITRGLSGSERPLGPTPLAQSARPRS